MLSRFKNYSDKLLEPIAWFLEEKKIHPNYITLAGLFISLTSSLFYAKGNFVTGAVILTIAGLCDLIDGNLARKTGKESAFGGFLDSTIDRLSDSAIFAGIAYYSYEARNTKLFIVAIATLIVSYTISYVRARAECIIPSCKVGLMERPERFIVVIIASIINQLFWGLLIVTLLGFITIIERISHTYRNTKGQL